MSRVEREDNTIMADVNELLTKRVIWEAPGMTQAQTRKDLQYATLGTEPLAADVYYPAGHHMGEALPAILFICGDAPPDLMRGIKNTGQYISWGQLAAASGCIGITADHRSTEGFQHLPEAEGDIRDLLAYVHEHAAELDIDLDRIGVWIASGGPPFGLRAVLAADSPRVRCIAAYYPLLNLEQLLGESDPPVVAEWLREYSPVRYLAEHWEALPPLLIARAGRDHPALNSAIDAFILLALANNAPIEVHNHPTGQHGFDILDDDARSREIVQRTLAFFQLYLA
jgi:acetyl esterase/lipase